MHTHRPLVVRARGTVIVAVLIVLFILSLVVATVVQAGARDHDQTGKSAQGLRAAFAANSAAEMAVKEMMDNVDRDGDGTIGTISNDSNTATDPTLGVTRAWATKTVSGSNTTITGRGANADAARAVQVALSGSAATSSVVGTVLLVVADATSLSAQESAKQSLIQSWGYTVALISESASQASFDAAVRTSSVAYISETSDESTVSTKLKNATIGVVSDEGGLCDEYGISTSSGSSNTTSITITSTSHYITSGLSLGSLTIATNNSKLWNASGTLGGFTTLATLSGSPSLVVMERGASLAGGGSSAGRRVFLPWRGGSGSFSFSNDINSNGTSILQRSIEWCLLPVAHYKLDDSTGTTAVDAVAGRNGTLTGPTWAAGNIGGGLSFNGSSDYLSIPDDSAFHVTGALSVAGWIKASTWPSDPNWASIILRKGDADPNNWELHVSAGKVTLTLDDYDTYGIRGNTTVPLNSWQHVAATWDGSIVRIYLNGVLDNTPTARAAPIGTDTRALYIGGRVGSTDVVAGSVDDVRLYSRALTAAEVAALAAGSGRPKVTGWTAVSP